LVGAVTFCSSLLLESWPNFLDLPAAIWGWLFLSFTLATAGRFTLQTYAQGISSPEHAAVIMILEPVWTALFAAFWFAERMEATQILGCGFILLALLIHRLKIFQKLN
ncbi:MAG: EamA family transporter, partial [Venatoribacter sp.]